MNKNRVCIIDDDSIYVYGTKILLNHNKFFGDDILVCDNGEEALATFQSLLNSGSELPDFIFLDLDMPIMDGWEFLERFNAMSVKNSPVIFLVSNYIDHHIEEEAKKYDPIKALVQKPLSEAKLQELLRSFK